MALLERATRVTRPSGSGRGLAWPAPDWMGKGAVVAGGGLLGFDEHLGRSRDGCALIAVAALTPVVSASNGVATLALHGVVSWSAFWEVWRVWWIGDALGIVLVFPVLLTWRCRSRLPQPPANLAELAVVCGLCLTVSVVALSGVLLAPGSHYQLQYAVFPFVLWAALRLRQHVSTTLV